MVDRLAQESPHATYGIWPNAPEVYAEGFHAITYAQFAIVINGLAQFLINCLGPGNGQVLTYVGPNDVRLTGLMLATVKTGYVVSSRSSH